MLQTISIIVTGNVQGVYYRQSTREKASELGISGQVKNLPDGNVHIVATGMKEQLEQFIDWAKKGPPRANVAGVDIEEVSFQMFHQFIIVH
jgi:acylphosphatase